MNMLAKDESKKKRKKRRKKRNKKEKSLCKEYKHAKCIMLCDDTSAVRVDGLSKS